MSTLLVVALGVAIVALRSDGKMSPDGAVSIEVDMRAGWRSIAPEETALSDLQSADATSDVSSVVGYYVEMARSGSGPLLVVAAGNALLVVEERSATPEALPELLERLADEASTQGRNLQIGSSRIDGIVTRSLTQRSPDGKVLNVEHWLDAADQRYVIDVTGTAEELVEMLDAIEIKS